MNEKPVGRPISRRDFLRMAGVVAATIVVPEGVWALSDKENRRVAEERMIHGVEVYGLNKTIKTKEEFDNTYVGIDKRFIDNLPPYGVRSRDSWKQREFHWGENVRALEVVVRKSDFENDPLSNDFTLRMLQQVDMMNRVLENSKPKVDMKAKLARIIVVDDGFGDHPAGFKHAKDVDFSEFINNEEGENENYWEVFTNKKKELVIKWGEGKKYFKDEYVLKSTEADFLTGVDEAKISYYLFHEWWHRLFNVPDEYVSRIEGVDLEQFGFSKFMTDTGSFTIPWISPYIASLVKWKADLGIRGFFSHPLSAQVSQENMTFVWKQRPKDIGIKIAGASKIECFAVNMNGGYYPRRNEGGIGRTLASNPDQVARGSKIILNNSLFEPSVWHEPYVFENEEVDMSGKDVEVVPTVYVIKAKVRGKTHVLHVPVAAFNLSAMAEVERADYEIKFVDSEEELSKSLYVNYVDKADLDQYLKKLENSSATIHATMEVVGTSVVFVWFYGKLIPIPRAKNN